MKKTTTAIISFVALLVIGRASAAERDYPTAIGTADSVVISGAIPGAVGPSQVKIGGGAIKTSGNISAGPGISVTGDQSSYFNFLQSGAPAIGNWQLGADLSVNGFYLYSLDTASYVWKVAKASGQTIFAGTDPGVVAGSGEVRIGGGRILANGVVRSGSVFEAVAPAGSIAGLRVNHAGLADWYVFTQESSPHLDFWQSGTTYARLQADGKFLLGSTADAGAYKLQVTGNALIGNPAGIGVAKINAANAQQAELQFYNQSAGGFAIYRPANSTDLRFYHSTAGDTVSISAAGNVGIGTTTPTNKLTVIGTISAKEVKVTTTGADYVFEEGYKLRSLTEVEAFVKANRHLPEIAAAAEMKSQGLSVSEIVTKQLAKIEELTLYAIESEKRSHNLTEENLRLRSRLEAIERKLGISVDK